jgi:hypothetical protein
MPNGWHNLTLNISSVENAITEFGKPKKDETNKGVEIISARGAEWLSLSKDSKTFRKLTYEKPDVFAKANLYFKDNKLAIIELYPKYEFENGWLDPDDLNRIFDAKFNPHNSVFGGKPLGTPDEFVAAGNTMAIKDLRAFYEMIAVTEDCFAFASVDNREPIGIGLFGRNPLYDAEVKDKKRRDAHGEFPGFVTVVQIISRALAK